MTKITRTCGPRPAAFSDHPISQARSISPAVSGSSGWMLGGASVHGEDAMATMGLSSRTLVDHLLGLQQDGRGDGQPEQARRLAVDDELEAVRLLDGHLGRAGAAQDLVDVHRGAALGGREARAVAHEPAGLHRVPEREHGGQALLPADRRDPRRDAVDEDRKSTRLNSSHVEISYAVFCLKKKNAN